MQVSITRYTKFLLQVTQSMKHCHGFIESKPRAIYKNKMIPPSQAMA